MPGKGPKPGSGGRPIGTGRPMSDGGAAVRANASRIRGPLPNEEERELLTRFKRDARVILCNEAKDRLFQLLRDPATPPELFLRTFELVANRSGLPPILHHQVEDVTPGREVVVLDRPIPWIEEPNGEDAVAGDHDGRGAEPAVN